MTAIELMIWSMAIGTIGAVVLVGLSDVVIIRSAGTIQGTVYHLGVLTFVLLLSGIPVAVFPQVNRAILHDAQVLIGPLCGAAGNFWIRGWLSAHQRDRFMELSLRLTALLIPVLAFLCFALPLGLQLPAAAALCALNAVLILWLGVRAYLMGDKLALGVAVGALLVLPAVLGLYALAIGVPGIGAGMQALFALSVALSVSVVGMTLWQRNRQSQRMRDRHPSDSQLDPVTKLLSGIALVKKLIKGQRRRRRTRRDGAVLAVMVFNTDQIVAQTGQTGANQMFIQLANRIQRQVGVVNPVGRYYDSCFVTLVETLHSSGWLRTLGLRVASSLRRPMELTSLSGEVLQVRVDIGVGVVHLVHDDAKVDDILHDAQRLAEAARGMRSRAAILDPTTGEVVAVEMADLGPRHTHRPASAPHAVKRATRPARI